MKKNFCAKIVPWFLVPALSIALEACPQPTSSSIAVPAASIAAVVAGYTMDEVSGTAITIPAYWEGGDEDRPELSFDGEGRLRERDSRFRHEPVCRGVYGRLKRQSCSGPLGEWPKNRPPRIDGKSY